MAYVLGQVRERFQKGAKDKGISYKWAKDIMETRQCTVRHAHCADHNITTTRTFARKTTLISNCNYDFHVF